MDEHERRMEIIRLRREGMSVAAIAKKIKVRNERVVEALAEMHAHWRQHIAAEYETLMAEEVGELYLIRSTALESFENSKSTKKRSGDSKYLEIARRTSVDIGNFLGLNDRELFEMRRAAPVDPEEAKVLEMVATDREEIEQLRNERGDISVSSFLAKLKKNAGNNATPKMTTSQGV